MPDLKLERARLRALERDAWRACEDLRRIEAGKGLTESQLPLRPLAPDMQAWAARLLPHAEAAWQRAKLAAERFDGRQGGMG
ncbi:MAG TPA: hypothetical protein VNF75_03565 [Candidatus Dormibacteraeota bacterium]|nr:hypothetical protein [Candidatus Dormibacteraeota bacterium]